MILSITSHNTKSTKIAFLDLSILSAKNGISNPARALGSDLSDEDKKKLEEHIRVIVGEIEDEEKGHRQAKDNASARESFLLRFSDKHWYLNAYQNIRIHIL